MNPRAMAAAKDSDDVYIYAGETIYGESAVAVQLSANQTAATVIWRYDRDPKLARIDRHGVYFGNGLRPAFNGVASMADGSTFLCGNGPADHGSERPGLLTHLDRAGRVISEQQLLSSNAEGPPADRLLDPENTGARSNHFDTCLLWDGYVGAIGRVLYFPREEERRAYYWIVVVDSAGKIAWQRLVPVTSILSETAELTSARITPHRNLLFTRHSWNATEIVLVDPKGELVGSRRLEGYFVAVSSATADRIQVVGGDQKGRARLIALDEELRDLGAPDSLDLGDHFVVVGAYRTSDAGILLFGRDEGNRNFSSIRYVTKQRTVQKRRLIHDDLIDEGTIKVPSPTPRPNQFIVARNVLKSRSGNTERLGVALNVIQTPAN